MLRQLADGNRLVTLIPQGLLQQQTLYAVTVAGVTDLAGNVIARPDTATFTTGTGIDLISPAVVTVSPPQNATDVAVNTLVTVVVSERLSPLSLNSQTNLLRVNATSQVVPGTLSLSTDLTTVIFVPDAPLDPGTVYRLNPGNLGLEDLAGNNLSARQVTFTTEP